MEASSIVSAFALPALCIWRTFRPGIFQIRQEQDINLFNGSHPAIPLSLPCEINASHFTGQAGPTPPGGSHSCRCGCAGCCLPCGIKGVQVGAIPQGKLRFAVRQFSVPTILSGLFHEPPRLRTVASAGRRAKHGKYPRLMSSRRSLAASPVIFRVFLPGLSQALVAIYEISQSAVFQISRRSLPSFRSLFRSLRLAHYSLHSDNSLLLA